MAGMAPHVARAIAAVQAKLPPAAPRVAAHVAAAIGAGKIGSGTIAARPVQPAVAPVRTAPHLLAAQARMATPSLPRPPAAHVAAACRNPHPAAAAVQAMKRARGNRSDPRKRKKRVKANDSGPSKRQLDTIKLKNKILEDVSVANTTIHAQDPDRPDFFAYGGTGLMTQPVSLRYLEEGQLKLSAEETGISSLALSTKNSGKLGPEVQFGTIRNTTTGDRKFRISTNEQEFNDQLRQKLPKSARLEDFYNETLRPVQIEQRRSLLAEKSAHLLVKDVKKALDETFTLHKKDQTAFRTALATNIGYRTHRKFRRHSDRVRSKAARNTARVTHKDWPVEVTANLENIHSESSVLLETPPEEVVERVIGTKVPCASCTTLFHRSGAQDAILEHVSGAWLSEPSLRQLGYGKEQIRECLIGIHAVLGHIPLFGHHSKDGDIRLEELTLDSDPSSDSEDEAAYRNLPLPRSTSQKAKGFTKRIDDFVRSNFV